MKCPRCESSVLDERERERDGVTVDVCRDCRGIWLDRSELERILARAMREQQELEATVGAGQQQPPQQLAPAHAPPPHAGYAPPQAGYAPPPQQHRYRDDDTPPHGYRRDGYHPKRKKHWFESLSDVFD